MKIVTVKDNQTITIGRVGENKAKQIIWKGLLGEWRELYGEGIVQLAVRRPKDSAPYPATCEMSGDDVIWTVSSADVAFPGIGECELSYLVDDVVAKSKTWLLRISRSLTGDNVTKPPKDPAKSWFTCMQSQIGDIRQLETDSKDNLVSAINEVKEDIVQSDWNQNDPSAKDYVKNRTHWTETVLETVISEQTVTTEVNGDVNGAPLSTSAEQWGILRDTFNTEEAPTFSVVFDGVKYSVRWFETNGDRFPVLGNFSLIQPNVPDTGEPFCVFRKKNQLNIGCKTSGTHTITASMQMVVVHTIDHKYIGQISPNDMGDVSENGIWSIPYTSEFSPEFWADDFSYFNSTWLVMNARAYPIGVEINGKMFSDLPYSEGSYGAFTLGNVDAFGVQISHPERNNQMNYLTVSSAMFPDGVQSVRIFKTVPVRIDELMLPESAEWVTQYNEKDFIHTNAVGIVNDLSYFSVQHLTSGRTIRVSTYNGLTVLNHTGVLTPTVLLYNHFTKTEKSVTMILNDGTPVTQDQIPKRVALVACDYAGKNVVLLNPEL